MQTREDIFATLRDALVELFELEAERVTLDANLYQDLEIDSIDAVSKRHRCLVQEGQTDRLIRLNGWVEGAGSLIDQPQQDLLGPALKVHRGRERRC
jgi:hypothetical protein